MKFIKLPSQEKLIYLYRYNPDTGMFFHNKGCNKGKIAGSIQSKTNRIRLCPTINGKYMHLSASRVAYKIMTGNDPDHEIDHINEDKTDNRWCNLRPATHSENQCNKTKHGRETSREYKGVYRREGKKGKLSTKWCYVIRFENKRYTVHGFNTEKEAFEARCAFGKQLQGDFYNAGGVLSH
jgi:hypothetical protein